MIVGVFEDFFIVDLGCVFGICYFFVIKLFCKFVFFWDVKDLVLSF